MQALQSARAGEIAFSLMRPPATTPPAIAPWAFCYLNTVAITALEALATAASAVAVYDFDVHHGNGTETR
jgi:acetoin utilization deacetylase AcuC-like enzyme